MILGETRRRAGDDGRPRLEQEVDALLHHPLVQREGRVVGRDVDRPLAHDVPGVGRLVHVVERDARARLAVDQHPVERRAAAVLGQQRPVQVEGAKARLPQHRHRQHAAVVEGEDEIRIADLQRFNRRIGEDPQALLLREIEEARGSRFAVHLNMFFGQMPATWPNQQGRYGFV